ncbi:FMN-linked oxidoreductase [Leucogyrophana mollusca]|uniref:FMN-linked oxidoreductase n=1 Tax=Leucogyrophana mollusca TaxID=85980 RepID=A0ACB8BUP1_9AGAM|nr:FMN-linked oxidoreductase [Leucogyrophana mollusca]
MSTPALFQPAKVGDLTLQHRVVLAPLTRFRAYASHVPGPQAATYYAQRASTPGTLLITEATFISHDAGGYNHVPGIYTEDQIKGWKEITDAVHAKGSYIYLQLWALGRAADESVIASQVPPSPYVSASPITLSGHTTAPRSLTTDEIHSYVQAYATAASNAVHKAGFDGVEIHGANGYLIDQFLQDLSNSRTDEYGGSVENRSRFALEVVDAVVKAVGATKTGIRLSPWSPFQDMGMKDPVPTYSYLVSNLTRYDLAYIHVTEPRVGGNVDRDSKDFAGQSNDFIRKIWGERAFITAGGFTRETALETAEEKGGLVAFGRLYIPNPDLPRRLKEDLPLTKGDRATYYQLGDLSPKGYSDWPFAEESKL